MKKSLFILKCLTNLHVGSGSFNYDIVDNQVERDKITDYPTIYSSSLKGAVREHFDRLENDKDIIVNIFGGKYQNNAKDPEAGKVKFFDCKLLALPVRSSKGKQPYYMVTTWEMLHEFCLWAGLMTGQEIEFNAIDKGNYFIGKEDIENVGLEYLEKIEFQSFEDEEGRLEEVFKLNEGILKNGLFILSQDTFGELSLPIRARNYLEQSKSMNLWYEEHVPYKTLFFTSYMSNGELDSDSAYNSLIEGVDKKIIQVGGNASIGFGLIEFNKWGGDNGEG